MGERKLMAGHVLRRLRRQQALSQAAMADMLSISPSYLNLIERNQRPVSATLLVKLAETFDFDPRVFTAAEPGGGRDAMRRRRRPCISKVFITVGSNSVRFFRNGVKKQCGLRFRPIFPMFSVTTISPTFFFLLPTGGRQIACH